MWGLIIPRRAILTPDSTGEVFQGEKFIPTIYMQVIDLYNAKTLYQTAKVTAIHFQISGCLMPIPIADL